MDFDDLLVVCNNSFMYKLVTNNQLEWIYSSTNFMNYTVHGVSTQKSVIYYAFKTTIRLGNYNAVR